MTTGNNIYSSTDGINFNFLGYFYKALNYSLESVSASSTEFLLPFSGGSYKFPSSPTYNTSTQFYVPDLNPNVFSVVSPSPVASTFKTYVKAT